MQSYLKSENNLPANLNWSATFNIIVGQASIQKFLQLKRIYCPMLIRQLQENRFVLAKTFAV